MELVKAIGPFAGAIVALIAVFVGVATTRRQIAANTRLALRSQRRETLMKASETAHKLEMECNALQGMRERASRQKLNSATPAPAVTREELGAWADRFESLRKETASASVALEVEGLAAFAEELRNLYSLAQSCMGTPVPSEAEAILAVRNARSELTKKFAEELRVEPS